MLAEETVGRPFDVEQDVIQIIIPFRRTREGVTSYHLIVMEQTPEKFEQIVSFVRSSHKHFDLTTAGGDPDDPTSIRHKSAGLLNTAFLASIQDYLLHNPSSIDCRGADRVSVDAVAYHNGVLNGLYFPIRSPAETAFRPNNFAVIAQEPYFVMEVGEVDYDLPAKSSIN